MSERASHDRAEELLLAKISAAAGQAHLGRRRHTYRAAHTVPEGRAAAVRSAIATALRHLRRRFRGRNGTTARSRLDFYEHGMTVAIDGRIHVVRYDTTEVRRRKSLRGITRALVLADADSERIALRHTDFDHPEVWGPEIRRAVTHAHVLRALAALERGERLNFGPVWVTRDKVGSRRTSLRWPQVQRVEVLHGSVVIRTSGRWQVLGARASRIPNDCVLHALAEYLRHRSAERHRD